MPSIGDVRYWEESAQQTRAVAEKMTNEQMKAMLVRIANDYENLARLALEWSSGYPDDRPSLRD
jgi:hypothetical protein